MRKPSELRALLEKSVPELQRNPDRLLVFIDGGVIRSTAVRGLSFQYAYTLNLIVTDFSGDEDAIVVPLIAWLRTNQPDLFMNTKSQEDGIVFEADIINSKAAMQPAMAPTAESVRVDIAAKPNNPGDWLATIEHLAEPPIAETRPEIEHWELVIEGETVAEWDARPPFETNQV